MNRLHTVVATTSRKTRVMLSKRFVPFAAWLAIAVDVSTLGDKNVSDVYRVHFPISVVTECSMDATNPLCWTPFEGVEIIDCAEEVVSKIETFVREKRSHAFRSGFIDLRMRRRRDKKIT